MASQTLTPRTPATFFLMASSLMASKTLILRTPTTFLSPQNHLSTLSLPSHPKLALPSSPKIPSTLALHHPNPNPKPTSTIPKLKSRIFASSSTIPTNPDTTVSNTPNPTPHSLLTGSTRTIATLLAITLAVSKLFAHKIFIFGSIMKGNFRETLIYTAGPIFFAAMKDLPTGNLNTPLSVVAAGMAKWLDIYSGVLMVRVLLSWFPNIPWDRQPLSAIRDLCDPYLNLFRNIIPPIFDTLDVSPLLAFAVLGTLGSILNSSRGAY
ncbi:unnamed protein product [Ilex paraguariensis]|uniref:Uncharacterized protein n=1 Tax=Ilex paraguariensis TaxID=185542 RepID=A0ABC8R7Z8_9AQUA